MLVDEHRIGYTSIRPSCGTITSLNKSPLRCGLFFPRRSAITRISTSPARRDAADLSLAVRHARQRHLDLVVRARRRQARLDPATQLMNDDMRDPASWCGR
jgi:hypothetical protein